MKIRNRPDGFRLWDTAAAKYIKKTGKVAKGWRVIRGIRRFYLVMGLIWQLLSGAYGSGWRIWGEYHFRYIDPDPSVPVRCWTQPNLIPNAALNYILNIALGGGTQITSWYLGLVSNGGTPTFAAADTHDSHAWTEFTDYSQGTRPAWTPGTSTAQSISNSSAVTFSITGAGSIKGSMLSNVSTKGSTAGGSSLLFSEAAFSDGVQSVSNGGTVEATYVCNAAST